MIDFQCVTYRYPAGDGWALRDFDWHVDPGQLVVVTGPSGSGKSTLLRCLTGLIPHFHGGRFGGRVVVVGHDTRDARPGEMSRLVGFVAQDPETQTVMERVEDEVAFGPENHRLARDEMRLRVEDVLERFGVAGLRGRELVTLSGGERQRVVIAAAMAMRPPVLVLDEPTSQLDPWGAEDALQTIRHLPSAEGTTVVLVEHRLDRALDGADRLLVLGPGAVVLADGAPAIAARALPYPPPLVALERASAGGSGRIGVLTGGDGSLPNVSPGPVPAARSDVAVALRDVRYAYRGVPAIDHVSLDVQRGQVTALMGRNGSGKTTLLKLMNGLLWPLAGTVRLMGRSIAGQATRDVARTVAYAPQNPSALLFNDTVSAELGFTLRSLRRRGDAGEMLRQFGLAAHAERNPLDLSTGERQRVALAAVLVAGRPVILLDEPTRGMDEGRKRDLGVYLRRQARSGAAPVVATHDAEFVARWADRVVILEGGRVAADGPMREVLTGGYGITTAVQRALGGTFLLPEDVQYVPVPGEPASGPDEVH